MSMEKDTCQKSGTSVIFQKEITQCRECPHCRIAPDPDDCCSNSYGSLLFVYF